MELIKQIKENKVGFIISCIAVSICAFFIHLKQNTTPDFTLYFSMLPLLWLALFIFMILFIVLLDYKKEIK